MPWSPAQHRLFEWAAHNPSAAQQQGYHIKQGDASRMASEGIKRRYGGLAMASGGSPTYAGFNPLDTSPQNEVAMMLNNFGGVHMADGGTVQNAVDLLKQANDALASKKDDQIQADLQQRLRNLLASQAPGYAEGGDVDLSDILKTAAIAAPAAMMSRRPLNMLARPIQRRLARPVMGFESVRNPEESPFSDLRMEAALHNASSPMAKLPVFHGQGAFMNQQGKLETNPLYAQELPRVKGRLDQNPDIMKYAGEVGNSLNQWGVPVQRAIPNLFDIPAGADSLLMNKISPEDIKALAKSMPSDTVVSHRPGNKALVFSTATTPPDIRDIRSAAMNAAPGAKARYAVSRPGVDRVLVGEEPWMDATYQSLGLR